MEDSPLPPASPPPAAAAVVGLPRAVLLLLATASAVVIAGGIKLASSLLGSIFLALVLTIAVAPLAGWARRKGCPAWLSTLIALVAVYAVVLALALGLAYSAVRLAGILPEYAGKASDLIASLQDRLASLGLEQGPTHTALENFDFGRLLDLVGSVLGSLLGVVGDLFFLVTLLFFLAAEATGAHRRLGALAVVRPELASALHRYAHGTRSYLLVTTVFGFIVAVLDTLALWALGVPVPVVWGLLSFLTNFIPNVGFIIGLIPPALLALLDGGLPMMLAVIAVYCVINVVLQTFIQPRFVGDAVGISTLMTFLSLALWGYLLGALGALLAVPMTLLVRALLVDADPRAAWAGLLIGPTPPDREPD